MEAPRRPVLVGFTPEKGGPQNNDASTSSGWRGQNGASASGRSGRDDNGSRPSQTRGRDGDGDRGKRGGFLGPFFRRLAAFALTHAIPLAIGGTVAGFAAQKAIVEFRNRLDRRHARREESQPPTRGPMISVRMKPGETLGELLVKYVGDYSDENLKAVLKMNPAIWDPDLLVEGEVITLPDNRRGVYELDVAAFSEAALGTRPDPYEEVVRKAKTSKIRLPQDDW